MSPRALKITFLVPPYLEQPIGAMLSQYECANHLVARGHEVALVHHWGLPETAKRFGFTVPAIVQKPSRYWFQFDERVAVHHIREFDPSSLSPADIVFNPPGIFEAFPRELGLPVAFVRGFGWLPPELELAVFRAKTRKIAISRWIREELQRLGVPDEDIAHVPNGLDHATFRVLVTATKRPCRVAMLYHAAPGKGASDGLAALELVRERLPETEAIVFGTEPRPHELPTWIDYRQLPSRLELAESVYNASAVFVCSSHLEGFFNPGLEAMACGCALATTDALGVRDYAEAGVTALLSRPRDPRALAENVLHLLCDDGLRSRLVAAGLERAEQFSWERSTLLLEQHLLRWLEAERR